MEIESVRPKQKYTAPLIMLGVALLYSLPFLINWNYLGVGDWELFTTMAAIPVREVLHYHQFPFWNPYIGGGNILFAHPEVGVLSPFFLIILVFGALAGLKIQVLITYFLGLWGTYLLARKWGLSDIGSYLVAFAYYGSTYFGLHNAIGHMPFTHFCFLPWFLYFLFKSDENWKYLIGASLSIFLIIIGNGAAVPLLFTLFFAGFLVLLVTIESKRSVYLKGYCFAAPVGVLLAGVKFVPMLIYFFGNPWTGLRHDFTPLKVVPAAFFSLNQDIFRVVADNQHWGWHEYSAYMSPVLILLAVVGFIFVFRKARLWLIVAIFFFLLGMGHFGGASPWNLLLQVPGFRAIRVPSRMFQFMLLGIGMAAGYGLDYALNRLRKPAKIMKSLALAAVAIVLISNLLVSLPALMSIAFKKVEPVPFSENFQNVIGRKDNIYHQFQENHGSLVTPWLSGYKDSRALITPTNEVLGEFVSDGQAEVVRKFFTPNRVAYEIKPGSPGNITFSIGYDKGWRATDGRRIFEKDNLLAIDFGLQDTRIEFYYRTPYFWLELLVSLLAWGVLVLLIFNRKAGKRLQAVFN